jgi:hypothetical protein
VIYRLGIIAGIAACGMLAAGETNVSNLGGAWVLNGDASKWAKHERPTSIVLNIVHQEPSLKYSGEIIKPGEEASREFSFDGAIDGKAYPARGPGGDGTMAFKRVDARTVESLYSSNDKTLVERGKLTVSADGKHLTRQVQVKSPGGEESWTEVYDRK